MQFQRPITLTMLVLSISCSLLDAANAQGLIGRFRERREQNQQTQQQTSGQAQVPSNTAGAYSGAGGEPQVSMVTLQTQPGANGQQMVITPKGLVVPLPGAGVNGPAVQIYMGAQGGYWYVDKFNQQVDLTQAVRALQSQGGGQAPQTVSAPQYAPPPPVYNSPSSGTSAAGTAAAAGLGAMTGAMLGNSMSNNNWNNVPYGTPIHYGAAGTPYYNQGGKPVYINASNNTAEVNQAEINNANSYHAANMQQQQEWYRQQQAQQTGNWKNWQQQQSSNPFVRSDYQQNNQAAAARRGNTEASSEANSGGRFGRGEEASQSGRGRFGREQSGSQEGSQLNNANRERESGRFNNAERGQSGRRTRGGR